jgi:hypothetical protein
MAFQVTISNSKSEARFWFIVTVALILLGVNYLGVLYNFSMPWFSLINLAIAIVAVVAFLKWTSQKTRMLFLKVEENEIEYFNGEEKELVSVDTHAINNVDTGFNKLRLHTRDQVHVLDLSYIRDEKKRWEIKEAVRGCVSHVHGGTKI